VAQEVEGNSWVGGILTLASKENTLPAVTGGVDWNMRLWNGSHTVDGYSALTRSSSPYVKRNGSAGRLLFSRLSSEHWFYTVAYGYASRFFDPNDLGFFAQPHDHGGSIRVVYRENFSEGLFRRYSYTFLPESRWNWDGVLTSASAYAEFLGEHWNFWRSIVAYRYSAPAHDDAERGVIGTYRRPAGHVVDVQVKSDERKDVAATLTLGYERDAKQKKGVNALLSLNLRPAPWMELTPSAYYRNVRGEEAWVFPFGSDPAVTGSSRSLFGDRDIDELDLAVRGIVTFTRTLSLQFYTQMLVARGMYGGYKLLVSNTEFVDYDYASFPEYRNPEFNQSTFNANVLLRWEYLPGSTIYLVWTQGRFDDRGDYSVGFGRRFSDTFAVPHEDVLLLKMTYYLPL
jgi:hypothetical protein